MVLGSIVAIVGTGLLTRIALDTPTVQWATYMVISGVGLGLGINLPYTALQVVLRYIACSNSMTSQQVLTDVLVREIFL